MSIHVEIVDASAIGEQIAALREEGLGAEPMDGEWLAASESGAIVGVARTFERDGDWMLEDVWVEPSSRNRGIGRALVTEAKKHRAALWLICDEEMVSYYERLGFIAEPDLPKGLSALNSAKGYWQPPDHIHIAMRSR